VTTIAYDGKTLAADRQMGDWMNVGKIFKLKDGRHIAGAGKNFDAIRRIVAWLAAGAKQNDRPDIQSEDAPDLLIVDSKGACNWMTWPYHEGLVITEPFFAVGSGCEYALGALAAGANARRAVEIACRFDSGSGKGIDAVRVVKPTITQPRRKPARKG